MRRFNARHSFAQAWHSAERYWFDGHPACRITPSFSDSKWDEAAVGVLALSAIGAVVVSRSGQPLPFTEGKAIKGELTTPFGPLAFTGRTFVDTTMKAYIALDQIDATARQRVAELAVSCVDPSFRCGTVKRLGSVAAVAGALSSALRRDLLDACSRAGILDLARVRHATVDGIALCLIAHDRFGIQIGRCSDHVTWHMRGWTNHKCENFCGNDEMRHGYCQHVDLRRNTGRSEAAA